MKVSAGVTVDFTYPNSINTILGFDSGLYHGGKLQPNSYHEMISIFSV